MFSSKHRSWSFTLKSILLMLTLLVLPHNADQTTPIEVNVGEETPVKKPQEERFWKYLISYKRLLPGFGSRLRWMFLGTLALGVYCLYMGHQGQGNHALQILGWVCLTWALMSFTISVYEYNTKTYNIRDPKETSSAWMPQKFSDLSMEKKDRQMYTMDMPEGDTIDVDPLPWVEKENTALRYFTAFMFFATWAIYLTVMSANSHLHCYAPKQLWIASYELWIPVLYIGAAGSIFSLYATYRSWNNWKEDIVCTCKGEGINGGTPSGLLPDLQHDGNDNNVRQKYECTQCGGKGIIPVESSGTKISMYNFLVRPTGPQNLINEKRTYGTLYPEDPRVAASILMRNEKIRELLRNDPTPDRQASVDTVTERRRLNNDFDALIEALNEHLDTPLRRH